MFSLSDDPFSQFDKSLTFVGSESSSAASNLKPLSGINLSDKRDDAFDQIKGNLKSVPVIVELAGSTLLLKDIKNQSAEEVERASAKGDIALYENEGSAEGVPIFKFPEQKVKELASLGINSVQFHGPSGVRTFTSFKIQALSDKELDLLITKVKAQIVLLKAQAQANPEDEETKQEIAKLEKKLSTLVVERAVRKNDPKLQEIVRYTSSLIIHWR